MEDPPNHVLTDSQRIAVEARGNVLVMAGAGTGKTRTLVERCLALILSKDASLDEILVVTFTEAAAAEMRQRLRDALERAARSSSTVNLPEQLGLFDAAHIGTLHGFCFELVREHFHALGLDPQPVVLDEGQTRLLAIETIDEQFESHYANSDEFSMAVQDLIKTCGNGRDEGIRALVLRLHEYIQTRANAGEWLSGQIEEFSAAEPGQWRKWYSDAVTEWREEWLPVLEGLKTGNVKAAECLKILAGFPFDNLSRNGAVVPLFEQILEADRTENYSPRKKGILREPLEEFFDDAAFLGSLAGEDGTDPLAEDWEWSRGSMKTLLRLAQEFGENFSGRKRADGVLDFHDLEQFALRLLWDFSADEPSTIAQRWRQKIRFVFVDEYQDINAAQDKIISALSREGREANRFLVGDVKQSIYRFRQAEPEIFQNYAREWMGRTGKTMPLTENFRSREALVCFINSLFEQLMSEESGGVHYNEQARLIFGTPEKRRELSHSANPEPRAELLFCVRNADETSGNGNDDWAGLQESEKEARIVALRLRELKNSGHKIWDEAQKGFRPAEWRDITVLLRSPSGKAEIYAAQFERAGVPLLVERGGFYDSSEVSDLLSLLRMADNPLQDVPCIAVLRSPLVGCSLDELARIRLAREGPLWFALDKIKDSNEKKDASAREKARKFLEQFGRWRRRAQQTSLSECLEEILSETHYDDWLLSRPRAAQRRANVSRFLEVAEKFDGFQRQGLFRFLKFVDAQREVGVEPEIAPLAEENAVRLMSIHQSKGAEFPIVALVDLGKRFNEQDLHGEIILDEEFGLCSRVKPPGCGGRYPSLAYWRARKNQRRLLRGEELRLLYVALTRARDTIILSGAISAKNLDGIFENGSGASMRDVLSASSCMDWLGIWFRAQVKAVDSAQAAGQFPWLRWRIIRDEPLNGQESPASGPDPAGRAVLCPPHQENRDNARLPTTVCDESSAKRLREVLARKYPFEAATRETAKTSVTTLRRQAADGADNESSQPFAGNRFQWAGRRRRTVANGKLDAADTGTAHHRFLQHLSIEPAMDLKSLQAEAARLQRENYLSAAEAAVLDLGALAHFWDSPLGRKIRANTAVIKRELPFTAAFSPGELPQLSRPGPGANLDSEVVVVQGVADLVALLPGEIWLVDFKTDDIRPKDLPAKIEYYRVQLRLYAQAFEKIYSRPVTVRQLYFLSTRSGVDI